MFNALRFAKTSRPPAHAEEPSDGVALAVGHAGLADVPMTAAKVNLTHLDDGVQRQLAASLAAAARVREPEPLPQAPALQDLVVRARALLISERHKARSLELGTLRDRIQKLRGKLG
ncbi:MAG: hypothetical protein U0359_39650 [Byssovorax sp.]